MNGIVTLNACEVARVCVCVHEGVCARARVCVHTVKCLAIRKNPLKAPLDSHLLFISIFPQAFFFTSCRLVSLNSLLQMARSKVF